MRKSLHHSKVPETSATEATEMLCALRVDVCRPQSTREEIDSSEEDDNRRGANRSVLAGKGEAARLPVDAEAGDRVAPLVARVKEITRGIDVKAARIIASRPGLAGKSQDAPRANGKEGDAVVQPVGRIDEPPVRRDHDLRSKIGAGEALGQA